MPIFGKDAQNEVAAPDFRVGTPVALVPGMTGKSSKPSKEPKGDTPILDALLTAGIVWVEGSDYVGVASDGKVVSIGLSYDKHATEQYLQACPTPDLW